MSGIALFRVLVLLVCGLGPAGASAVTINLFASLSGAQKVPSNPSPGSGTATVTFDDVTNMLDWNVTFSDLSGAATAAHFHGPAPAGANAGVQVDIGAISGLNSPMVGSTAITAGQAADLLAGLWYINIHTAMYPGGEIRGQVQVVPLPATAWLFLGGLAGLFGWNRFGKER